MGTWTILCIDMAAVGPTILATDGFAGKEASAFPSYTASVMELLGPT